jgi:hypothetical protein
MIDQLFVLGRFGMLAVLMLFMISLARLLARNTAPDDRPRKKVAAEPPPKPKPKQQEIYGVLRLLQGDNKVWVKDPKGEKKMEPGDAIPVGKLLSLGRAPGNDIRLEDPFASAFHARIKATPSGIVIEDLGTTNGTRVNGVRINGMVQTQPGDIIDVGSTSFAVEE